MPASRLGHYRRSCDRCHDQKLRCNRDDDSSACQRCLRAKAKCSYSVPHNSRPNGSFVFSHHTADSIALNMAVATTDSADEPTETRETAAALTAEDSSSVDDGSRSREYTLAPSMTSTAAWDHGSGRYLPLELSVDNLLGQTDMEWDALLSDAAQMETGSEHTWVASAAASVGHAEFSPITASNFSNPKGVDDLKNDSKNRRRQQSGSVAFNNTNTANQLFSNSHQEVAPHTATRNTNISYSRSRTIRKLSHLGVELHDFALTIPPVESCLEPTGNYRPLVDKEFALDGILKLSQLFIETLNQLSVPSAPASVSGQGDEDATSPDSATSTGTKTFSSLDQPCELLILSSYTRIIETYHAVLEHVAACANGQINGTLESPLHMANQLNSNFPRLPALSVGSFTMESSSATQVLMLVHMIEVMMTRSRYLIQSILRAYAPPSTKGTGAGPEWDGDQTRKPTAAQAALQGFRPQEEATVKLLAAVRRALFQLGHGQ